MEAEKVILNYKCRFDIQEDDDLDRMKVEAETVYIDLDEPSIVLRDALGGSRGCLKILVEPRRMR